MTIAGFFPTEIGLWVATVVFAGGVAFTFPAIVALSVMGVPADERGAVVGTTSIFLDVSFGLSPALLGLLAVSTGYPPTFLVSGVIAAIGATYLLLRGGALPQSPRYRRPRRLTPALQPPHAARGRWRGGFERSASICS
jgi:MFS family permease